MFEEPVNTELPPLDPATIRTIKWHYRLRWLSTMAIAVPSAFLLLFGFRLGLILTGIVLCFWANILYMVAGKLFPMCRYYGTAAVEYAEKEFGIQRARERLQRQTRK